MKLGTSNIYVKLDKDGNIQFASGDKSPWVIVHDPDQRIILRSVFDVFKRKSMSESEKLAYLESKLDGLASIMREPYNNTNNIHVENDETGTTITVDKDKLREVIQQIVDFFSEFSFEPNFRFLNTLAYCNQKNLRATKSYISQYFELTDSQYTETINEKMKSAEFKDMMENFKSFAPTHKVNNRFKLYYGSAGTGKTTKALEETNNNCMVCHSAMLPADLMEDFKFNDGKAEFIPSALQIAMVEGKAITLDEINLLPFESLRFLQTILDGKKEFSYKGKTIQIKDGFKIVGTMNLVVNGSVYSLPEPLVDRAEELRKYKLTAEDLIGAII